MPVSGLAILAGGRRGRGCTMVASDRPWSTRLELRRWAACTARNTLSQGRGRRAPEPPPPPRRCGGGETHPTGPKAVVNEVLNGRQQRVQWSSETPCTHGVPRLRARTAVCPSSISWTMACLMLPSVMASDSKCLNSVHSSPSLGLLLSPTCATSCEVVLMTSNTLQARPNCTAVLAMRRRSPPTQRARSPLLNYY